MKRCGINMKNNKFKIYGLIIFIATLVFIGVAIGVQTGYLDVFDDAVRYRVYSMRSDKLTVFWRFITHSGDRYVVIILGIILLLIKSLREKYGVKFAIAALSSTALYQIMKYIFQRPRPDLALRLIEQGGYSFPSGHSMNCLVSYGILIYLLLRYCENRRLAKLLSFGLGLLIILIGFSRVYVGVHYPTDIIGGWSLGIAVLVAMIYVFEKFDSRSEG
jgi:membrane-associated phospholipid phosphatase